MKSISLLFIALSLSSCGNDSTFSVPLEPNQPIAIVPKKMLVIGDSISIGYTPFLQLSGYEIQHGTDSIGSNGNASDTRYGLNMIDFWLGNQQWDIVTFNWGIHDFAVTLAANSADETEPLEEYKANLMILATKIKAHSQNCFWITTTDIPVNVPVKYDPGLYRNAALEVMQALDIPVIDLLPLSQEIGYLHKDVDTADNVHYVDAGYNQLADFINKTLKEKFL